MKWENPKPLPKRLNNGYNTSRTIRNCYKCKKFAIHKMNDYIFDNYPYEEPIISKKELHELYEKSLHTVKKYTTGNPFRGRTKFAACRKIHRSGSFTCLGSKGNYKKVIKVHERNKYHTLEKIDSESSSVLALENKYMKQFYDNSFSWY